MEHPLPAHFPADHRPRILVVQENRSYLGVLSRRLVEGGYRVVTADGASRAIAELHRVPVDLVLAELNMRPTTGAELTRIIRGEIHWRDLPIMLITGRSDTKGAVRAYEAGADDVIAKPFHFDVLIARIARRLARAQSVLSLRDDNAALDARVVERALAMGELKDRLAESEAERRRLQALIGLKAPE
ncbi:MAG: PleD family two-component system response regulator [Sphingomicrobium sp.]